MVKEIETEVQFASEHKSAAGKLVVVDFHALWCGPCKQIAPIFEQLSIKYSKEAVFLKVDVDKCREIAQSARIEAMPSFGFYINGQLLELQKGGDPRTLEDKIKSLAAKHSTYAFKGTGHALGAKSATNTTSTAAAGGKSSTTAPPVTTAAPSSARRNPWSDPNFKLAKAAATDTTATAKPTTATATATANKPAATNTNIPVNSHSSAAAKPITTAASTSAPAAAAKPAVSTPAPASTAATASTVISPSIPAGMSMQCDGDVCKLVPTTTAATNGTESAAAPAPATATAATTAPSNDSRLKVNPELLSQLTEMMGFSSIRAEKALILTSNRNIEAAVDWLTAHENDIDIDEPLQLVGTAAAPAASTAAVNSNKSGINLDELDEDERAVYEEMQKKKAPASNSNTSSASTGPVKKSVSEMTSEEKMQWLDQRRAEAKAKRAHEAIEKEKSAYKNTKSLTTAVQDMKEAREQALAKEAFAKKQREEAAARAAKAATLQKIADEKARRKVEQEKAMAAAKASKEAAAAGKK